MSGWGKGRMKRLRLIKVDLNPLLREHLFRLTLKSYPHVKQLTRRKLLPFLSVLKINFRTAFCTMFTMYCTRTFFNVGPYGQNIVIENSQMYIQSGYKIVLQTPWETYSSLSGTMTLPIPHHCNAIPDTSEVNNYYFTRIPCK